MSRTTGPPASALRPPWNITVTRRDETVRVDAHGELGEDTAKQLDAVLHDVEAAARRVTIDLHELTAMDSSGVDLLTEHVARAERDGFALSIVLPGPNVARAADAAGVRDRLPLAEAPPDPAPEAPPEPSRRAPVSGGRLQVWIDDGPERVLFRLVGELDLGTAPRLRQAVDAHAREGQPLVVDLREVGIIDSMGLAALVSARHRAHARGAHLQLVAAPAPVHVVFILTGLQAIFDWIPGEPQPA
jgi:anti-sigma B factor antagonist